MQPAEGAAEPPQIKGPVERKEEEVVQLDRPDAGKEAKANCKISRTWGHVESLSSGHSAAALPEGEAHRHEPPIPQDEVRVDSRKNNAELEEKERRAGSPEEGFKDEPQRKELGDDLEADNRKESNAEEKHEEAAGRREEGKVGGQVLSSKVLEKPAREVGKEDSAHLKGVEKPVKDAPNENAAGAANQAAGAQVEEAAKQPNAAEKGKYLKLYFK